MSTTIGTGAGSSRFPRDPKKKPPPPPPPRRGPPDVDEIPILRELGITKQQLVYIVGVMFGLSFLYHLRSAGSAILVGFVAACFLIPAPTPESFNGFFKGWFLDKYMPKAGKMYRDSLKARSRREDTLTALGTTFQRWFHKATEDINNTLFYELSLKHALPYARKYEVGNLIRVWQVNLGSAQNPAYFNFLGILNTWVWIPVIVCNGSFCLDFTVAIADGGVCNYAEVQNKAK